MNKYHEEIMENVRKLRESSTAVIVEGIKDKLALEELGIKNIITLNKRPLFEIVEEVSDNYEKCAILTDLDKEGKKLFGKLNSGLSLHGVKVDNHFREFLFKKTKLRQIEGIDSYVENNQNQNSLDL